ncbi:MAG: S-methyl-5-thioribose-1-phosphate isomerase, partial [Candidatus Delongbacteria bacterium]|nr:S-methyl-5-thioribose-1-phosphate isomerase [Candidatus Delongbacteria bacterium]
MKYDGKKYRSLWYENDELRIIDQRALPSKFRLLKLRTSEEVITAIKEMKLRGAPLIGVAAAYAVFFAFTESLSKADPEFYYESMLSKLKRSRPTAVNLIWAANQIDNAVKLGLEADRIISFVKKIENNEIGCCKMIGDHGVMLLKDI